MEILRRIVRLFIPSLGEPSSDGPQLDEDVSAPMSDWERGRQVKAEIEKLRQSPDSLSALLRAVSSNDPLLRRHAVSALSKECHDIMHLGPVPDQFEPAVTTIAGLLCSDEDAIVHQNVYYALKKIRPHTNLVIDSLIAATESSFQSARASAASALREMRDESAGTIESGHDN